ncbi:histidine ammonia-lyase-like isoform X2, partial [Clarias magur]
MWSPQTVWTDTTTVLDVHGLTPISLQPKEGLSLINGTQMISSLGAEAVERAEAITRQADVIAALTLETLKGTSKAFDTDVPLVRPHLGQILVAQRFCSLSHSESFPSEITERGIAISGGNFHGEYPAKCGLYTTDTSCFTKTLDFLAIGVHELASIILAIELHAACQALDCHRPLKTTAPLEKVYELVRAVVRPWDKDRAMFCDIEAAHHLLLEEKYIFLDGNSLTTANLVMLGEGLHKIKLSAEAEERVIRAKDVIDKIISGKQGVGPPLSPKRTRMLLALRINVLAKGYSGISLETLHRMVAAFNASCLSWVPEQGTVGASGDLAPLAHLALGLMGEGRMWSPQTGWTDATTVLEGHGLTPISLKPKEMISSLGAEAVERAEAITRQADVIAALTLETLKGTNKAFDTDVHAARPHPGQILVAQRLRSLVHSDQFPSEITDEKSYKGVQDAYTLRCCPQVHGIANDTIAFVKNILNTELNSATDNPLVFPERGITISGGNFHGEYPAKALDFLAIGVHELASISERRIERLCNPSLSNLPAFLVKEGGLNTGFMVVHCTAAALVSENKVLCHPASVDSLSTSAATEDHVSMGGWAARKALKVVEHVEQVLAIELLAACQALEFHRPLKTTAPLEKVYELVRSVVRPWDKDRVMSFDIEAAHQLLVEEK